MTITNNKEGEHVNYLFSTRDKLLINNFEFPALEHFIDKENDLKTAYINWLSKENLSNNVLYIDLTFEIPPKDAITIILASNSSVKEKYANIMQNFINADGSLYFHKNFKEGLREKNSDFGSANKYLEHYLLHKFDDPTSNSKDEDVKSGFSKRKKFIESEMPLKDWIRTRGEKYKTTVNNKTITVHWNNWIDLNKKYFLDDNIVSNEERLKWIMVVPLGIVTEDQSYKHTGSVFIGMNNGAKEEDVILFARSLIMLLLSSSQRYYEKKTRENAIKSAIAAVMSRNMSHNLGSHVFYYTRQELLKIYDREKDNKSFDEYSRMIKGMAWFMHYVQERQDFIANINSGDDFLFGPLNFKQDVIDEITPDGVDSRHNSLPKTRNYLLENIVRSEKIVRLDHDIITYDEKGKIINGINVESDIKDIDINVFFENAIKKGEWKSTWNKDDIEFFYDIDMAVGGGQQSRHAFLILLENIIRNSAKHGAKFLLKEFNKLIITINIEEKNIQNITKNSQKELPGYEITIYDNTGNAKIPKDGISGTTNIDFLKKKLQEIKMLEENSIEINRECKGLKEILISVLWMKGLGLQDIEQYSTNEKILSITEVVTEEGTNIGFRFSLPKFQNTVNLQEHDIESLLCSNEINAYGSIYTVDDSVLKSVKGFDSIALLKKELELRIPRITYNVSEGENVWQKIYEERMGKDSDYIISFDRDDGETINELEKRVVIKKSGDKNAKIVFKNHLSQSEIDLENCREFFETGTKIVESISGANQVFNLMQKFKIENKSSVTPQLIDKLTNLYWNVLEAYNLKVVIVDERLSYSDVKKQCIDQDINDLINKKQIDDFCKIYFKNEPITRIQYEIFTLINNEGKDYLIKRKEIIEYLDQYNFLNASKEDDQSITKRKKCFFKLFSNEGLISDPNGNVKIIKNDIKELFYNQQNTWFFDLNENQELIQSSGKFVFPEHSKVDFFSIHIGLLDKMEGKDLADKIKKVLSVNNIESRFISVHSGRGGLNNEDEKVTFIPFSVLQRCLEDSKYVLSEFLNSYKYYSIN